MRHHAHLVQTGLAVEEYVITVFKVSLHYPSVLKQRIGPFVIFEIDTLSRIADYISCTRILLGASPNQIGQVLDVVAGD